MTYLLGDKPQRREAWLKSLPFEVRIATELTDKLVYAIKDNRIASSASLIATCLKGKVWEHIGEYEDDGREEVKQYHPMEWMREVLRSEPGELMNIVSSPLVDSKEGAEGAIALIDVVREYEPESFAVLIDRENNPANWFEIATVRQKLGGTEWAQVFDHLVGGRGIDHKRLDEAKALFAKTGSKAEVGRIMGIPRKTVSDWINGTKLPRTSGAEMTTGQNGAVSPKPNGQNSRERILTLLTRLSSDPAACLKRGTTTDKVKEGHAAFLTGATGQECLRIAGLDKKLRQPSVTLKQKPDFLKLAKEIRTVFGLEYANDLFMALDNIINYDS